MRGLRYADILSRNRELAAGAVGKTYRIALLSNIVVNQLADVLEYALRSRGLHAEVTCGDYDNFVQDSIRFKAFDAAIIFWEPANIIDGLHVQAESMKPADLAALAGRVEQEMALTLENLREVPLLLFNGFSALLFERDNLRTGLLQQLCDRLNAVLRSALAGHHVVVDINKVLAGVGLSAAADFRQFQSSKALYSIDFLKDYAEHVAPAMFAATGRMRKVLVLDCDNTLWGGVLGEDGEAQIQMGTASRAGRIFREVQHILKGFQSQGVMLALCSKNNTADVDQVLSSHPDMVLRDVDLVAKKVNWLDKATNLRALAAELNVGLDSLVFVDDSAFELGLVSEALPQVTCIQVPTALSEYPGVVRALAREFFALSRTDEDLHKTEMYRDEQARSQAKERIGSLEDYLRSLELVVRISWNAAVPLDRAAQLTQKTNQFNLTTRRYTEGDMKRMLEDPHFVVASIDVADRYGGYGVTGLAILSIETGGEAARVDTLLMSCRIIGRHIEQVFFDGLVQKLRSLGVGRLHAEYLRTAKNAQVSDFYGTLGLSPRSVELERHTYELTLSDHRGSFINYIEVTEHVG